jgi:hypothetical protein
MAVFIKAMTQKPELVLNMALKIPDIDPRKPHLLNGIGHIFLEHFHRTRSRGDIDKCVLAYDLATQLLPVDDAKFMHFLHDSGTSFFKRYNLTGNLADINQAMSKLEIVVKDMVNDHAPNQANPVWVGNLGILFSQRFKHTGNLTDLSKALSWHHKSVQLTPEGHPDMPAQLDNLGTSFLLHFKCTGDVTDISKVISCQKKAVQLTPEGHPKMPAWLNNLGNLFQVYFQCTRSHQHL